MARILIYGGSFNPPTLAHEAIIRSCLALSQFDAVWVMPSGSRADKSVPTSEQHRLQMLDIVRADNFGGDSRLVISDFELQLPRPSETRRTVHALAATYPDLEFWFAFGGDSYRNMHTWVGAEEYIHDIRMVIFSEVRDMPKSDERLLHLHLPADVQDVSSTEVRAALARGDDIDGWVSPAVAGYIKRHGLYRSPAIL